MTLEHRVRPAAGRPAGALVLLHGRGADEHDLFGLLDGIDPERRLLGVTPRGPLSLPPGGAHWYAVRAIGYPDPATFGPTFAALSAWLDGLLAEHGLSHDRLLLGGFSQGAVMSHALSLAAGRPRPAGLIALSGFVPTVDGLVLDPAGAEAMPALIAHGSRDPVIGVEWGRDAAQRLEGWGLDVSYRESAVGHQIDPAVLAELPGWADAALAVDDPAARPRAEL